MTLTEPIPGQSVLLAIKPERIHITPGARHPAGRAELRGQVANRSFLGAEEQFTVQTACGDLAVRMVASNLNGQMSIDTTSAVTVTLPPAGILLFAACAPAT
jgi:ABC-type Fe3+/spermidine/putrescine transport system ATPase subunit